MSLFCAKGRYERNLVNELIPKNLKNSQKIQLNDIQNKFYHLQNQLTHFPTKSEVLNIKSELDEKCEQLKKLKQHKEQDNYEEKQQRKKKIVKKSEIEKPRRKRVNYTEEETESSQEEEEEERVEKKPTKPKVSLTSHVCSQCFQEVKAVDAIHGLCRSCIIQQRAILSSPFMQNNIEKKSKKDKINKKSLIELGYTRALKDVKNKKIPFKKNTSDSDDE
ncbi:hepatoma-derived growth factor-related protein 2-like [Hydra vulgaris]|uniref:hepatoma-derived growth factor-related protein 2-like n=1 Tax=Hydra vulgaris TaxID=6087 RepID=UPI0032EA5A8E